MASFMTFGSIANRKGRSGKLIPTLPYQVSGGGYPGNGITDISINKTNGDNPGSLHTIFFKNPATANYTFSTTADLSASILIVSGGGGGGYSVINNTGPGYITNPISGLGWIAAQGGGGGGGNVVVYDSCGGKITTISKNSTFSINIGAGGIAATGTSKAGRGLSSYITCSSGNILSSTGTSICYPGTNLSAPNNGSDGCGNIIIKYTTNPAQVFNLCNGGVAGGGAGGAGGNAGCTFNQTDSSQKTFSSINGLSGNGTGGAGGNSIGGNATTNGGSGVYAPTSGGGGGPSGATGGNGRFSGTSSSWSSTFTNGTYCTFMNKTYGMGGRPSNVNTAIFPSQNSGDGGSSWTPAVAPSNSNGASGVVIIQVTIPQPA